MQHEFNLFLQICLLLAKINFVFLTLTTWSALYYLGTPLTYLDFFFIIVVVAAAVADVVVVYIDSTQLDSTQFKCHIVS